MGARSAPSDRPTNDPAVEAAFEAAPAEQVAEILDGVLHTFPRPRVRHVRAASRLGAALAGFDRDDGHSGGWVTLDGPELHLGPRPDKIVPDAQGAIVALPMMDA